MQPLLIFALVALLTLVPSPRSSPPHTMASLSSEQQQEQPTLSMEFVQQQIKHMTQQYEHQMSVMKQENQALLTALQQQQQWQQQQQQQQLAATSSSSPPSQQPGVIVANQQVARIDLKPLQPSAFNGTGNQADQWLAEVERYFMVAGLPETDTRRVPIASTYLKEVASGWYTSMASELGASPTWSVFRAKFLERFRPIAASRVARAALRTLKHRYKVAGYTQEFQKHMQHIDDMSKTDQIEAYLGGLQQHLAAEVDREQPQTLAAAMEIAQRVELRLATRSSASAYGPPRRGGFVTHRSGGGDRGDPMELSSASGPQEGGSGDETGEHVNAMSFRGRGGRGGGVGGRGGRGGSRFVQHLSPEELEKLYKEGRCFNCKEQGHAARFCDKKSKN